ncbi:MAG: hypothetical protein JST28_23705 [Acidobacteria bacterium]|nr:hypothetical protein [Acidobacteriota bacterium]
MPYLEPAEYSSFGLPDGTSSDWVTTATALINSFCRRPDLNITQYIEKLRVVSGSRTVRLSYLPLAAPNNAISPIVAAQGRYGKARRGEAAEPNLMDEAFAFSLPGQWNDLDPQSIDFDANTGEITLPCNFFGLPYNEVSVTYTAGLSFIGDDIKSACAQIVRNAQATPALNASKTKIDTMQMQYFSSSLLDETVQTWLRPYVASRLG